MVYASPPENLNNRQEKDAAIQSQRPVIDIPDVQSKFGIPVKGISPVHLSPSRDSWAEFVPPRLFGRIARQIANGQRTRPDKRHFPGENVKELRQFVQRSRPQESPDSCQPIRVTSFARAHRAELEESKRPPAASGAFGDVENRPAFRQQNQDGDEKPDGGPQRSREQDNQDVENSLHDADTTFSTVVNTRPRESLTLSFAPFASAPASRTTAPRSSVTSA